MISSVNSWKSGRKTSVASAYDGGPVTNAIQLPDGSEASPPIVFQNQLGSGWRSPTSDSMYWQLSGVDRLGLAMDAGSPLLTLGRNNGPGWHRGTGLWSQPTEFIGWTPTADQGSANADTRIYRGPTAGQVELRNGATAHNLALYRSQTDLSNYERLLFEYNSGQNKYNIATAGLGTGSAQKDLTINGIYEFKFTGAQSFRPLTASRDLGGSSAANRWANVYVRDSLNMDAQLTTDVAPVALASVKMSYQWLASAPTNAAYLKPTNSPTGGGGEELYVVFEA